MLRQNIHTAKRNRCNTYLRQAQEHLANGNMSAGYRTLVMASTIAVDSGLKQQGRQLASRYDEQANLQLAQAEEYYENEQYTKTLAIYKSISSMPKLKSGQRALQFLIEAQSDPVLATAMRDIIAARLYRKVEVMLMMQSSEIPEGLDSGECFSNTSGGDNEFENEYSDAELLLSKCEDPDCTSCSSQHDDYQLACSLKLNDRCKLAERLQKIVSKYKDTPTGEKSNDLLTQLIADDEFSAQLQQFQDDADIRNTFSMANIYQKNKLYQKAEALYHKVIEERPSSEWSRKALLQLSAIEAVRGR